jgi:hypothetical protein
LSVLLWNENATPQDIILFDISLIGLVILFRELKEQVGKVGPGICAKVELLVKGYVPVAIFIICIPALVTLLGYSNQFHDCLQWGCDRLKGLWT